MMVKRTLLQIVSAAMLVTVTCSCTALSTEKQPASTAKKLKVGLYIDKGASGCGVYHHASLIAHSPQAELITLMAKDIQAGKLKELDVLVMPGGGSNKQCTTIGKAHHDKIRDFLRNGGGYVGTCAGMFNVLGCRLQLLPFDRYPGAGGSTSSVTVEVTEEASKILGIAPGDRVVRYSGGPVVYPTDPAKCEGKGISLGAFKSSVSRSKKHIDKFMGAPGWIYGTFGKGKVIATSFHPEYEEVNHDMMLACYYAVAGVKLTPVWPKKNFRPVRVGLLATGLNGHGPIKTMVDLERHPDIDVHYIMMSEIQKGMLRHLDYLVMPHADGAVVKHYMNLPFPKKALTEFLDNGGVILAEGNATEAVADHKNVKKLPKNVDFKKYIKK